MVLALYSFGTVVAQSCGISSIACLLSGLVGQSEETVRQRLRESLYEAEAKRGDKRQAIEVSTCFAWLLRWIMQWWAPDERRMALALDASTLGQRFTVLVISVLYRGCALPVAWVVLPATKTGAWMPHWKRLLCSLREVLPQDWLVIVLTDRGLYSKTLYQAIRRNGWHPLMRINAQGLCRPSGQPRFRPLADLVPHPQTIWYGQVECFKTAAVRLTCTLLAHWDAGFEEPWLLVTDLPPDLADSVWYALRMWVEHGFKDCKRGGFHWEQTKMTDPTRATRLWLVLALASLWAVSVGSQAEQHPSASGFDGPVSGPVPTTAPRRLSVFRRGVLTLLAHLLRSPDLPPGCFSPEPWPRLPFVRARLRDVWLAGYLVVY
jgi:hypothetical protein